MNRREFMLSAAAAVGIRGADGAESECPKGAAAPKLPTPAEPRNKHPYFDVDWSTAL